MAFPSGWVFLESKSSQMVHFHSVPDWIGWLLERLVPRSSLSCHLYSCTISGFQFLSLGKCFRKSCANGPYAWSKPSRILSDYVRLGKSVLFGKSVSFQNRLVDTLHTWSTRYSKPCDSLSLFMSCTDTWVSATSIKSESLSRPTRLRIFMSPTILWPTRISYGRSLTAPPSEDGCLRSKCARTLSVNITNAAWYISFKYFSNFSR